MSLPIMRGRDGGLKLVFAPLRVMTSCVLRIHTTYTNNHNRLVSSFIRGIVSINRFSCAAMQVNGAPSARLVSNYHEQFIFPA
jgi:hypothetical protein